MFGLGHLQAQLIASGVGGAVLIGVVVWLRADAADDREREPIRTPTAFNTSRTRKERKMRLKTYLIPIWITLSAGSCLPPSNVTGDALFKDVSRRPPRAQPETIKAIVRDRPVAEWIVFQARQCDVHGCL